MNAIDRLLNSLTMYRVVLYGLGIISAVAFILSFFGLISYSPLSLFFSAAILLTVCFTFNALLSKARGLPMNIESADISALILFLILTPPTTLREAGITALAAALAIISKHVLAFRGKHIFNPAAISLFVIGLLGFGTALWWVATLWLLPFVAIVGLLVVRKIKRFPLFFSFFFVALVTLALTGLKMGSTILDSLSLALVSYPVVMLGTIMLTEPQTMPPSLRLQIVYGAIVGVLFGLQFKVGPIYSTPELALVIGNIFSFVVSPAYKLKLSLESSHKLSADIYEFVFRSPRKINFKAGQYFEWTLPKFFFDARGNRRYFTIASSPTEPFLRIGVRIAENGSRFKKELLTMKPGDTMGVSSLSGDFVLPADTRKKLVLIAGGIGVTPFRSMAQYIIDKKEQRDIHLIYACLSKNDFVYQDTFTKAEISGWQTSYLATDTDGYLTQEKLAALIPDFKERYYFLSGPNAMVEAYRRLLREAGVADTRITTDYFPGY